MGERRGKLANEEVRVRVHQASVSLMAGGWSDGCWLAVGFVAGWADNPLRHLDRGRARAKPVVQADVPRARDMVRAARPTSFPHILLFNVVHQVY